MVKKVVAKKPAVKAAEPAKGKEKVTKESILVKLLSGKESYTLAEIIKKVGYSEASAKMYTQQGYLDRKEKPFKVVISQKGKDQAFRYEAKKK